MSPLILALAIVTCVLFFLSFLFTLLARSTRRHRAALEAEGIVREGPAVVARVTLRGFRGYGRYGNFNSGILMRPVLTSKTFTFLGSRLHAVPLADLGRYKVSTGGGQLHIATDAPVDATGHMEVQLTLPDADAWAEALWNAGSSRG